jgi:glycosyltransferase involved in cell wall biosynthesis
MMRKILFVGMVDSPHTARWIELIADQGWDLHFFPVYNAVPHPIMRNITIHRPWIPFHPRLMLKKLLGKLIGKILRTKNTPIISTNLSVKYIYPIPLISKIEDKLLIRKTKPLGESDVRAPWGFDPATLARLIKKVKPDLIHSMEFQHAGYTVLCAKEKFKESKFPQWLATNWGSDIYYYRQFPDHKKQISRLLLNIDFYSCECSRDLRLAEELGMKARQKTILPNTGGFDLDKIESLRNLVKPSKRSMIMIKGYQHFAGRALIALDALLSCLDLVKSYKIFVYSAAIEVCDRVEELRTIYNLQIAVLPLTSHESMLRYFANSRIYLGVSISDAISTSMLEAMAMGAFPIQTNTACCEEWIQDGQSGFSIPPENVEYIGEKLREALCNDDLVDSASELNWRVVREKLNKNVIRKQEIALYDNIFNEIGKSN